MCTVYICTLSVDSSDTFELISSEAYCTDYVYPNDSGYDDVSNTPEGCMFRCLKKIPTTTAFWLKGTQCGCSRSTSGVCPLTQKVRFQTYMITGTICHDMSNIYLSMYVIVYIYMCDLFLYDICLHVRDKYFQTDCLRCILYRLRLSERFGLR